MDTTTHIILGCFTLVNLFAFGVLWLDKIRSRRNDGKRISEGMLFFLATMFGSVGVFAGMFAFRHKTRKWYFLIGIPLLFFENILTVYAVYSLLVEKNGF
jgi:uncharacterized membrane protein YsdA (DUF1294 family)